MELHGLLAIDKPLGWTSHDVVGRLRRILRTRRIGHAGTLDPAATGVLITGVGRATRFMDFVQQHGTKEYLAHIVLGVESDSADIDGRVTDEDGAPDMLDEVAIQELLAGFTGDIEQIPPKYSAIKVEGEPLYRRARRGEPVEAASRTVHIRAVELISFRFPDLVLRVECGAGTYIRSLARDLGSELGCGAYLHHLVRTRVGEIRLDHCWHLSELESVRFPESWPLVATATDAAVASSPAIWAEYDRGQAWYHGRPVETAVPGEHGSCNVRFFASGMFAGLGQIEQQGEAAVQVRPRIVITSG